MKTALDNLKDLEVEVRQQQSRLDHAKSENLRLTQMNTAIQKQIEEKQVSFSQYTEKERSVTKQLASKVQEDRDKLETDRKEFAEILNTFKKDKVAFERERETAQDTKKNYSDMHEKLANFMMLIKREAAIL